MPVSIPPVNGDRNLFLQRGNQIPILIVDRAAASEMVIMFGNGEKPFARNISATQDIFEKRNYVPDGFRSSKGHDQKSLIRIERPLDDSRWGAPALRYRLRF